MDTSWFGTHWYALLYGHRDGGDAEAMALPIIQKGGLERGQALLDLGCGRGRHAEVFTREGLHVTGIDLSGDCIAEARRRVPQARFEVHDFREPYAQGRFDAAVCLFTSLGYTGRSDDRLAVQAAAAALKPGALFVLDLMNGAKVLRELVQEESMEIGGVPFTLQREVVKGDVVKHIEVEDSGGRHQFTERVHAWLQEEVEDLVHQAGLRLEDLTDGPEPSIFNPETSERIVAWARKPA